MDTNKKTAILIVLVLLQSIGTVTLSNTNIFRYLLNKELFDYPLVITIIVNVLAISVLLWIFYIMRILDKEQRMISKLNKSSESIEALRGQKHDFNNHLNVINGLIQLEHLERAKDYIKTVTGSSSKTMSLSYVENPEIAAVLYKKTAIAEAKGIVVDLDINTPMDNVLIDPVDLCAILFNLIDNAIHELDIHTDKEKILTIEISEFDEKYVIMIGNSFPIIQENMHNKIFMPGYSTKGENGHGYGLSIVKTAVDKANGKIVVEAFEELGTFFTVFLQKDKKEITSKY